MRLPLASLLWIVLVATVGAAQSSDAETFRARAEALKALLLEKGEDHPVPVQVLQDAMAGDGVKTLSLLRALIKDTRDAVREPALRMLAALGPEAAGAAPDLVGLLANLSLTAPLEWRRERYLQRGRRYPMAFFRGKFIGVLPEAVRSLGKASVPALIRALDGHDYLRQRALEVLEALGPVAAPAVPRLRALLTSAPARNTRILTIYALAEIGESARDAVPDLVAAIRDRDVEIRRRSSFGLRDSPELAAARALSRTDPPFVVDAFRSDDPWVRDLVRRALTTQFRRHPHSRGFSLTPAIARAYRWKARALAVVGLPDDSDMFAYLEVLRRPDETARLVALLSLPARPPKDRSEALRRLAPYLEDPSPVVRRGAVTCLACFGHEPQRQRASRLAGAALADAEVEVRRAALRVLGGLDLRRHRTKFQELLKDPNDEVSAAALGLLCRVNGPDRPPVEVKMLLDLMAGDHGPRLRVAAMNNLHRFPAAERSEVAAVLEMVLDDPSPAVRAMALTQLWDLAYRPTLRRLKPRIVASLEDADPRVRFAAGQALAALGADAFDAEPALRRLVKDPHPEVRHAVERQFLVVLQEYRRRFDFMREQLASEDPKVRLKAIDGNQWLGPQRLMFLVKALDDPHERVRQRAAYRIREMEPPVSLAGIYREATSWRVRTAILRDLAFTTTPGLGTMRPDCKPAREKARGRAAALKLESETLAAMKSDRPELRRAATQVAVNLSGEYEIVPRLFQLSLHPDPKVADIAATELRRRDEPKCDLPDLITMLDGRTVPRWLVLRKLNQLGEKATPALPALRKLLKEANEGDWMRGYLALTIATVGRAGAAADLPAITPLLDDPSDRVRNSAALALGAIGPPARTMIPALIKLHETDPAKHVRRVTLWALGDITHSSDELVPWFVRLLDSEFESTAIEALARVGPAARAAIPALEKRLGKSGWIPNPVPEALERIRPPIPAEDRDRTRCVSRRPDAATTAWGHSWNPSLSADGGLVAFDSDAAQLVGPAPDRHVTHKVTRQVYAYDRATNRLECVSRSTKGRPGNRKSGYAVVSRDGRRVAFVSDADNLVPGDSNAKPDIFVHDRTTGKTIRVSIGSNGEEAPGRSWRPSFSRDGRRVMFRCPDDSLVPADPDDAPDLVVHDLATRETTRAARHAIPGAIPGDNLSFDVRDADRARVVRVSVPRGDLPPGGTARAAALCGEGRQVVFLHEIRIGRQVDPSRIIWRLMLHDLEHGVTRVLLGPLEGAGRSRQPIDYVRPLSVSDDGRRVAFTGHAADFVEEDTNQESDVFLLDTATARVTRVSVDAAGRQSNKASHSGVISGDGRWVAFIGFGDNLTRRDRNGAPDVFVRRLD